MLDSTPSKAAREDITIKDVAELLLEGIRRAKGLTTPTLDTKPVHEIQPTTQNPAILILSEAPRQAEAGEPKGAQSKDPESTISTPVAHNLSATTTNPPPPAPERKKWQPKPATPATEKTPTRSSAQEITQPEAPKHIETQPPPVATPERKKWQPKTTTTQPTQPAPPHCHFPTNTGTLTRTHLTTRAPGSRAQKNGNPKSQTNFCCVELWLQKE